MKTITEFSGVALRSAHAALHKLRADGVSDEQLNEQLAAAINLTGDRLARMVEAVQAAGADPSRVRLVRVFSAEHEPRGAVKVGEFNYLIDLVPNASAAHSDKRDKRDGGRRDGGRGRGGPPGERRGPPAPRGLKSLRAPKEGDKPKAKDDEEDARGPRGPMPTVGKGWVLTPAPGDRRGPKGKRPGGRNERDRGRGRGDRPQGDRPGGNRPAGDRPGGNRPAGDRPRPPQGDRPPRDPNAPPRDPNAPPRDPNAPPRDPNAPKKRRHRGGRGRGRGGRPPEAGGPNAPTQNSPAPTQSAAAPPKSDPPTQ